MICTDTARKEGAAYDPSCPHWPFHRGAGKRAGQERAKGDGGSTHSSNQGVVHHIWNDSQSGSCVEQHSPIASCTLPESARINSLQPAACYGDAVEPGRIMGAARQSKGSGSEQSRV